MRLAVTCSSNRWSCSLRPCRARARRSRSRTTPRSKALTCSTTGPCSTRSTRWASCFQTPGARRSATDPQRSFAGLRAAKGVCLDGRRVCVGRRRIRSICPRTALLRVDTYRLMQRQPWVRRLRRPFDLSTLTMHLNRQIKAVLVLASALLLHHGLVGARLWGPGLLFHGSVQHLTKNGRPQK